MCNMSRIAHWSCWKTQQPLVMWKQSPGNQWNELYLTFLAFLFIFINQASYILEVKSKIILVGGRCWGLSWSREALPLGSAVLADDGRLLFSEQRFPKLSHIGTSDPAFARCTGRFASFQIYIASQLPTFYPLFCFPSRVLEVDPWTSYMLCKHHITELHLQSCILFLKKCQ